MTVSCYDNDFFPLKLKLITKFIFSCNSVWINFITNPGHCIQNDMKITVIVGNIVVLYCGKCVSACKSKQMCVVMAGTNSIHYSLLRINLIPSKDWQWFDFSCMWRKLISYITKCHNDYMLTLAIYIYTYNISVFITLENYIWTYRCIGLSGSFFSSYVL